MKSFNLNSMILLEEGGLLLEEKPGTTSQITNNQKPLLPK